MARKSNKTAHVLNLLAGHDAAKDADDQASIESEASGGSAAQTASGGAATQAAQANAASGSAVSQSDSDGTAPQAVSGRQSRQAAPQTAAGRQPRQAAAGSAATQKAPGRPARQPGGSAAASAAPVSGNAGPATTPAPVVSAQNNIAVIDKTGEDPVAELIQQKLSSEFEKQMKQSQPEASSAKDITPVPEMDAGSAEDSEYPSDALPLTEAEEILDDIDLDGLLLSDAEPIAPEPEQASSMNEINADAMILDEDAAEAFDDIPGADSFPEPEDESLILSAAEPLPESTPVSQPVTVQDAEAAVPAQETAVSPQPDRTPASAPEANLVQEAAPILQSASEPAVSAPAPLPTPEPESEPDFAAINVMEHIVRDKIIYFMRQFDVCTCDRCKADVTALTLNGLMPKYIVTTKAAVDPLLSYYTNRLISDVTVEATKSCMIVKENPRH
ncbi:late competence development ComFB family protein [Schaedlerella sp.]|uniref:late competence development ComFB family protein n=1 Tax=Schaedlerella sp. TaxID=2676057 RepID=UPI0037458A77